jgi:2-polyprenyl-3-methyl-5-hydroxy-6-metoxy-1,4-benzoquinol methylase
MQDIFLRATLEKYYKVNKRRWNELVDIHVKSATYNLEGFKRGKSTLHTPELESLRNVSGLKLLHLQCHFGLDTLSWARMGARVTGVDFSEEAIITARALAGELDIEANFLCSNIYDLRGKLDDEFDVVYTSYGVINWLHDIKEWGRIAAHYLKPGGTFFMAEFHPFMWVFDDEDQKELNVKYPYWHRDEPDFYEVVGSYADRSARVENTGNYEWAHTLSDILGALLDAGLTVKEFREYPYCVDKPWDFMTEDNKGYYRIKGDPLPLMFSVKAEKSR